jgi:hypothetical protein
MYESLKNKLWDTGGPFGDTLPGPRHEGRVFATHPYPFFLFFSISAIRKSAMLAPSLVWATLFLEYTWCFPWHAWVNYSKFAT